MIKAKALGKGIDALLSSGNEQEEGRGVVELDINSIEPNRSQPRVNFDMDKLEELAESIKEYGVLQPIIVKAEQGYYSIVVGERRWRAARMAQLTTIPALVNDYSEAQILQVALIENIQRQDLNPMEEAHCYARLADEYFFTQEEIAKKVGKSRNAVSQALSLLKLDERVQGLVTEEKLSPAHARALLVLPLDLQQTVADCVLEHELSVKETEEKIETLQNPKPSVSRVPSNPSYIHYENELKSLFGTKVSIKDGKNKGRIEIEYYSAEELDRLLCLLKGMNA